MENNYDSVLLPDTLKNMPLPKPLIDFFDKYKISLESAASFPVDVLRSLYREDFNAFSDVVYFLSLYGCNFHSAKANSFFPTDVHDVEDVLTFSDNSDSCFSVTDMNKFGVWTFCTKAQSPNCKFFNGVVVSRLKRISDNALEKILCHQGFSVIQKNVYGNKNSESLDDNENGNSRQRCNGEAQNNGDDSSNANNSFDGLVATGDSNADNAEFVISNEFFDSQKIEDSIDGKKPLNFTPIDSETGICSPRFWIRFVSSFFSMDQRAKDAYKDSGYETFEDLIDFKNTDIKKVVDSLSDKIEDPYLVGLYEDELIYFCKNREKFLGVFGESDSLKIFLFPSEFTVACIKERPNLFYYINLNNHPFAKQSLENACHKSALINDFDAAYLKMFGVTHINFIGSDLLPHSIDDFGIPEKLDYLCYFLNPINVVDSLCNSIMGQSALNAFGIDHEIYSLWIPKFVDIFFKNIGKYGSDAYKKHLDILTTRETTNATLEFLGRKYGLTRERIRQIETKTVKALSKPAERLIDSLFDLYDFLPINFAKKIPGLYSSAQTNDSKYYVDDDLGLILRKYRKPTIQKVKYTISNSYYLLDYERLDGFYRKNGFSLYGWLNKITYHLQYNPYPMFMPQKISLKDVGVKYLLSKGVEGYDINKDEKEVIEYFKVNAPYLGFTTYRAITNDIIRSGAILRGMSVYISPQFVTKEQKDAVKKILDNEDVGNYGVTGISLFEKHKEELLPLGIDNGYFVYGIAYAYDSDKYQFGGRSLRISRSGYDSLAEMVQNYISEKGPIVKANDLLHDLNLKNPALQQISNITKYDSSTLVLKSWFKWSKNEFEQLESFINSKISQQGFCHAYDLIHSQLYFDESKNGFLKENRIGNNPSRLIYFLDVMAERYQITKYHYSHHCDCISLADRPVETKSEMADANFGGRKFNKKEVESFFKKFHLSGNVSGSDFYSGWAYFINDETLVLKRDINISEEAINETSNILDRYYGDEIFITSITAINRLKFIEYKEQFDGKAIELASVLSDSDKSNWSIPENDIGATSGFFRGILVNKRLAGAKVKYSDLIRLYIKKTHSGSFLSLDEIQKELKEQELIDNRVTMQMLNCVFSAWFRGPIVEVPK